MKKDNFIWVVMVLVINMAAMIYILSGYSDLRTKTQHEIEFKDKQIATLEQEVADKDAEILSLNNRIYQYELQVQTLQDDLDNAVNTRITLTQRCSKLEAQLSDVDDLYGSYLSETEKFLLEYEKNGGTVEDIGEWKCTAYCTEKRAHICGTGTGITASGEPVQAFVSVAVNRHQLSWLPFGTHVYIEGIGERIVMDTGGAVVTNQFDCAVDTHSNALSWTGAGYHRAWVLREAE